MSKKDTIDYCLNRFCKQNNLSWKYNDEFDPSNDLENILLYNSDILIAELDYFLFVDLGRISIPGGGTILKKYYRLNNEDSYIQFLDIIKSESFYTIIIRNNKLKELLGE
jgi:hypothetical protein